MCGSRRRSLRVAHPPWSGTRPGRCSCSSRAPPRPGPASRRRARRPTRARRPAPRPPGGCALPVPGVRRPLPWLHPRPCRASGWRNYTYDRIVSSANGWERVLNRSAGGIDMTLTTVPEVELSAGTIEFEDTGGGGPVVVLLHGLLMDSSLWSGVVAELAADHRCIVPTLPLGAHRQAMRDDADLSLPGIAALTDELLERLGLRDV